MLRDRKNQSGGAVSGILLALGMVVLVIAALWAVNRIRPFIPSVSKEPVKEETSGPIYELVAGEIKFSLQAVKDRGNLLKATQTQFPKRAREDLTTTEKFIEVVIGAENIGKDNLEARSWDIKELVDSEGRKFYPPRQTEPWLPEENQCGALLKPGFSPSSCTKIYEVAKISSGLKARVYSKEQAREDFFVDLGI